LVNNVLSVGLLLNLDTWGGILNRLHTLYRFEITMVYAYFGALFDDKPSPSAISSQHLQRFHFMQSAINNFILIFFSRNKNSLSSICIPAWRWFKFTIFFVNDFMLIFIYNSMNKRLRKLALTTSTHDWTSTWDCKTSRIRKYNNYTSSVSTSIWVHFSDGTTSKCIHSIIQIQFAFFSSLFLPTTFGTAVRIDPNSFV